MRLPSIQIRTSLIPRNVSARGSVRRCLRIVLSRNKGPPLRGVSTVAAGPRRSRCSWRCSRHAPRCRCPAVAPAMNWRRRCRHVVVPVAILSGPGHRGQSPGAVELGNIAHATLDCAGRIHRTAQSIGNNRSTAGAGTGSASRGCCRKEDESARCEQDVARCCAQAGSVGSGFSRVFCMASKSAHRA